MKIRIKESGVIINVTIGAAKMFEKLDRTNETRETGYNKIEITNEVKRHKSMG